MFNNNKIFGFLVAISIKKICSLLYFILYERNKNFLWMFVTINRLSAKIYDIVLTKIKQNSVILSKNWYFMKPYELLCTQNVN